MTLIYLFPETMKTFCLIFVPFVLASTATDESDGSVVGSLEVLTGGVKSSSTFDGRLMSLIDQTNDFYLSLALVNDHLPIPTPDDMIMIASWMHFNLSSKIYDEYSLTISSLTEEVSRNKIVDWRVLSMLSSHLSIVPLIDSPDSLFHLSHQLGLVWRRIARNKPLSYTVLAMSVFSTGIGSSMPKAVTDFTIALFRCIDGQLVPSETLDKLIGIGHSMNRILSHHLMRDEEIREVFEAETRGQLDIASMALIGRWHSESETSVEYVLNTVYVKIDSMKERFDQLERFIELLGRMDEHFKETFGKIPQPILGGSGRFTLRSPVFLKYILREMNPYQLEQYLIIASDVILDDMDSSLSTLLGFHAALELGTVNESRNMHSLITLITRVQTESVQDFDRMLTSKWLVTSKSTWAWDIVGTLLNISILMRIAKSEVTPALISLANDLTRAMNEKTREKAEITSNLVIPCKRAIQRIVENIKSN